MKLEEWATISTLGFRIEVPQGFMDRPEMYFYVEYGLLFLAAIIAAAADGFRFLYLSTAMLITLAIVYFLAKYFGRKRAYNTFRRNHLILAKNESDPTVRAELEDTARLTDKELKHRLELLREFAT